MANVARYGIRVDGDVYWAGEAVPHLDGAKWATGWSLPGGKPVELSALARHPCTMEELAHRFGNWRYRLPNNWRTGRVALTGSSGTKQRAASLTWWMGSEIAIQPNQIFTSSCSMAWLAKWRWCGGGDRRISCAVRSLAPSDPQYRGRYEGNPRSRDGAYHQGTDWPWLMGPFLSAYLKVNGRSAGALRQASEWLAEFRRYIEDEGVGQIPEVFDGDAPQRPGGCMAQAWSVAELLRCLVEDVGVVTKSG